MAAQDVYRKLVDDLGLTWPTVSDVALSGADPFVDSKFKIGECAAAVLGAQAAGVMEIWRRRWGLRQTASIDAAAGALAAFSVGYQTQYGYTIPQPEPSYPLVAIYQTADQRSFMTHGAFPLLRNGLLSLLNCTMDPTSIAAAVRKWKASELEDAVAAAGLCGATCRSRDEWMATAQGQAVAATPLIEIIKIGESAPEPFGPAARPLSDINILDLTHVIAGPTIGKTLAEQGASVLHITTPDQPALPPFDVDTGHGKLAPYLTLTNAADAQTLWGLVPSADVFVESYRPGAISRLGFSPQEVAAKRPGIIYVSVNCYGWAGPWKDRPGWEQLAQVVTGMAVAQGGAGTPQLQPVYPNDYCTGFLGALGTLMALIRRADEGGSYWVRVSLCRTAMWIWDQGMVSGTPVTPDPAPYLRTSNTAFGKLTYLGPVLNYSQTKSAWEGKPLPLGSSPPAWPHVSASHADQGAGRKRAAAEIPC